MKEVSIDKICLFLKFFSKLRRDYKFGGAPHKPILLLANPLGVIKLFDF